LQSRLQIRQPKDQARLTTNTDFVHITFKIVLLFCESWPKSVVGPEVGLSPQSDLKRLNNGSAFLCLVLKMFLISLGDI